VEEGRRRGRSRRCGVEEAGVLVRRGSQLVGVLESHGRPPGLHRGVRVLVAGLQVPPPLLPPSPSPSVSGWRGQGRISPRAARVERTRGAAARLLIGAARRRARGRRGCSGAHGVCRDGGHARRGRALAPASAKGKKGEDGDGDIIVTHSGPHRSVACIGARLVACSWAAFGPKGEGGPFGRLRSYRVRERFSYFP
jgi:hypothetical protein